MAITDRRARWRLLTASLLAALAAGCTPKAAPAPPVTQTTGGLTVQMSTAEPPHTGDNTLTLVVKDAATGVPIGDANVTATADMLAPREPGASNSGRAQGNGGYQVPLQLPVATQYDINIQIQRRDGKPPVTVSYPIEATEQPGGPHG